MSVPSGGSSISQRGANLLFGKFFLKTAWKMKKFLAGSQGVANADCQLSFTQYQLVLMISLRLSSLFTWILFLFLSGLLRSCFLFYKQLIKVHSNFSPTYWHLPRRDVGDTPHRPESKMRYCDGKRHAIVYSWRENDLLNWFHGLFELKNIRLFW